MDSGTEAKARVYEKNLACLIRDLRNDLKAPGLPVVVAASRHGKAAVDSPQQVVHAAQMAVGDPAKHPAFAGTVASVDTTPYFRDNKQSPGIVVGGKRRNLFYGDRYNNNAESFLLIGEALGQAMLKLLDR